MKKSVPQSFPFVMLRIHVAQRLTMEHEKRSCATAKRFSCRERETKIIIHYSLSIIN